MYTYAKASCMTRIISVVSSEVVHCFPIAPNYDLGDLTGLGNLSIRS